MPRGRRARPTSLSATGTRLLKWVGAITAVISLILGAQQLTTWVRDSWQRRRDANVQIDLARQQAARGAFADAWASLDKAEALHPGDPVDSARIDVAFAWLQEGRPGPGRPFRAITDVVIPALDRALLAAQGSRRADLLAHVGWATFLRSRDGESGDPAARYREALAVDPRNVYANAMLGHWLMWTGSSIESARERFTTALKSAGAKRAFVRRFQIAALANRGADADAELLRVADEMRQGNEPLDDHVAERFFRVFRARYGRGTASNDGDLGIAAGNLQATYEWVVQASSAAGRAGDLDVIRERLKRLP